MSIKAWYNIPEEEKEDFWDKFYDELKDYNQDYYNIQFIEIVPYDKCSVIVIRHQLSEEHKPNIYIPVKYDLIVEYLLLNHQYLDEWIF